jgi:pSer/pThr/pTyr-binding forkhead associated (FHA) protein
MRLILTGPTIERVFDLKNQETSIGRDENNDLVIKSEKLSRTHCVFYYLRQDEKESFAILDKESKNGVYVDGVRIEPNKVVPIKKGTTIMLAKEFLLHLEKENKTQAHQLLYSLSSKKIKKDKKKLNAQSKKNALLKKVILLVLAGLGLLSLITMGFHSL